MSWLKSNWMPLAVGFAAGFYIARQGGVHAAVAKVKSKA